MMTIGQRLRRAIVNAGLTQREVAARAGLEQASISDILNDHTSPRFVTVERIIAAIGITFGELFDEPRIYLSEKDVKTLSMATELNQRLLANDAAQKALRRTPHVVRDAPAATDPADEVLSLPAEQIPETYFRQGARRAFRVTTDAMIGAGILEGDVVYVRPTVDLANAGGEIVLCRLNGALKVKRLDARGRWVTLASANPRYSDLVITEADSFTLVGVVVTGGR